MTFLVPALLAGLALTAVPVILHLVMRQQPKHQYFPAFRFLKRRLRTNQRKLRLRQLILLLLRMALIALICLALARPRILNQRLNLAGGQAVAAVFVVDVSPSMEYSVAGKSRLDEAKQRVPSCSATWRRAAASRSWTPRTYSATGNSRRPPRRSD